MTESFEHFIHSFLNKIARGRKIEYCDPLKSFVIHRDSTVPLSIIVDAWEM